jgi:hypothetical protein
MGHPAGDRKDGLMTLTIELSPENEQRLQEAAKLRGMTAEEHVLEILNQHLPLTPQQRAENYRAWLQRVHEAGDTEGDCTWDEILQRIDESRGEGRKLFAPELKEVRG